ncbi:hypothetical protein F5X99DRAFT_411656 [Biscogniauxia marginata]|nr:hypothetical protein F5X99DRAFT_411656 [Biscogniauxia marginata]
MAETGTTNTGESSPPLPERLTFGVEFEFLTPTLPEDKPDPHEDVMGIGPVLRVPSSIYTADEDDIYTNAYDRQEYVLECVRDILQHAFLTTAASSTFQGDKFTADILSGYSGWGVDEDPSLLEPRLQEYDWTNVEVQSPVEFSCEAAFKAISYAASTITSKYRCRVNHSTGLHVHVGQREERFPLEAIRRIGGLFWAAEPLLLTLQNPVRRTNVFCQSIRQRSHLAKGMPVLPPHSVENKGVEGIGVVECIRYLARDRRHGEEPISRREKNTNVENIIEFKKTREPGHYEPFQVVVGSTPANTLGLVSTQSNLSEHIHHVELNIVALSGISGQAAAKTRREVIRKRNIPVIKMPQYSTKQYRVLHKTAEEYGVGGLSFKTGGIGGTAAKDIGVFDGVHQIFSAPSSCHIAELLSPGKTTSLNLQSYGCYRFVTAAARRTIEFRFGEGVIDPWAETMARICVGLVRFALHAPVADYIDVLTSCDIAVKENGRYDVIDFLDDLCLFAEAEAAEKRIGKLKDEWGLEYVSSSRGSPSS